MISVEAVAKLLEALGASGALWIAFLGLVLVRVHKLAPDFLARRDVKVKVGDKEITFQLAADQIREQLAEVVELRTELMALRYRLEALEASSAEVPRGGPPFDRVAGRGPAALAFAPADVLDPDSVDVDRQEEGSVDADEELPPRPRAAPALEPKPDRVAGRAGRPPSVSRLATPRVPRVLWVDDRPDGNLFAAEELRRRDVQVLEVGSTAEGLRELAATDYGAIITDLGRLEGGRFNPDAGLELVRAARERGFEGPVVVHTSGSNANKRRRELSSAGATLVTASVSELLAQLGAELGVGGSGGSAR